ncbi:RNA polymerase sigma factor [Ilumatobacter coccineus]|uniref:Putative RNA polymerase ECF subfamily sigma factor n=1 Tax=Ilumatobacter coccineus (strain NBRC 103263 / KCTC 29153 / YM16-304) TaxID=1313172 RepID=A0A6C7E475_ILUCY|nr:sigma-70 family RNA polymerase sigma factor [Ilumatobacter coccineus]BAN01440.1 putative RNA polymerase ECF subfamily sigma factor [Ilumatobacter coccineus YM16-304]
MSVTETPISGELPIVTVAVVLDFDRFYAEARPGLVRALSATLGSAEAAADATDEALARAYQRWNHVGRLDNPAGWVYRVGLNHARNGVRSMLRRRQQPPHQTTAPAADASVADPAIAAALSTLSHDHRAVVVCRFLLGWSEQQTADALSIRPGTVKSRLSRALSKLERRLDHLRPEDS